MGRIPVSVDGGFIATTIVKEFSLGVRLRLERYLLTKVCVDTM